MSYWTKALTVMNLYKKYMINQKYPLQNNLLKKKQIFYNNQKLSQINQV